MKLSSYVQMIGIYGVITIIGITFLGILLYKIEKRQNWRKNNTKKSKIPLILFIASVIVCLFIGMFCLLVKEYEGMLMGLVIGILCNISNIILMKKMKGNRRIH